MSKSLNGQQQKLRSTVKSKSLNGQQQKLRPTVESRPVVDVDPQVSSLSNLDEVRNFASVFDGVIVCLVNDFSSASVEANSIVYLR